MRCYTSRVFRLLFFIALASAQGQPVNSQTAILNAIQNDVAPDSTASCMHSKDDFHLHVVTLNCWGLWIVAKQRLERIAAIGEYLSSSAADVVTLQEVWLASDAALLAQLAARGSLRYHHYFQGGVMGGELLTLSKHPILEAEFLEYQAAGDPSRPTHGDYFAGKGVGVVRISTPAGRIQVFNTHTCANYAHRYAPPPEGVTWQAATDVDAPIRVAQVLQLARFVRTLRETEMLWPESRGHCFEQGSSVATLVCGDFNAHPETLDMALYRSLVPGLTDTWKALHPHDPGFTANSRDNTFCANKRDPPVRIDYIFSDGRPQTAALLNRRTSAGTPFSDHLGIEAVISIPCRGAVATSNSSSALQELPGQLVSSHMSHDPLAFETAAHVLSLGAQSYALRKVSYVYIASVLAAAGVLAMSATVLVPWWRVTRPVLPLMPALQFLCCGLAPVVFITGFAGCGSVAAALQEAETEIRLLLQLSVSG